MIPNISLPSSEVSDVVGGTRRSGRYPDHERNMEMDLIGLLANIIAVLNITLTIAFLCRAKLIPIVVSIASLVPAFIIVAIEPSSPLLLMQAFLCSLLFLVEMLRYLIRRFDEFQGSW